MFGKNLGSQGVYNKPGDIVVLEIVKPPTIHSGVALATTKGQITAIISKLGESSLSITDPDTMMQLYQDDSGDSNLHYEYFRPDKEFVFGKIR